MKRLLFAGRRHAGVIACVAVLAAAQAAPTAAQPSLSLGGSLLFYPSVTRSAATDTLIQIANKSNNLRRARCFYASSTGTQLQPIGFDLYLYKQQPLSWLASAGRQLEVDLFGQIIQVIIPPVPNGFVGELLCVEVDASGFPVAGNALTGAATVYDLLLRDVTGYTAVALQSFDSNNGDDTLCLGGDVDGSCPSGAEYGSCADRWVLNHRVDDVERAEQPGTFVSNEIVVVACAQNIDQISVPSVQVQFSLTNEFESIFSASTTIEGFERFTLDAPGLPFNFATIGSEFARTMISGFSGIVVMATETTTTNPAAARGTAAANLYAEREADGDIIVLPPLP